GDLVARRVQGPGEIVDAVDPLEVHGDALEAVGDLAGDGEAFDATHLLEIGELCHLHAVQPHLPTKPPGPEGGGLPVVLHKADIVDRRIDAEQPQGFQVQILNIV